MTPKLCKTPACPKPVAHGSSFCVACLPGVEKAREAKKSKWWRDYYNRVRRERRGHLKRYKTKERP